MELVDGVPPSVAEFAAYLARWARGYGNRLKWDEKAKFKADLMNARPRWGVVSPDAFAAKLRKEGMREEDVAELSGWLKKVRAGGRLVPHRAYRGYTFGPIDDPGYSPVASSPDWT